MPTQRKRILTTYDAVAERLKKPTMPLHFRGKTAADWRQWRRSFRRALVAELGPMPERVPLRAEVVAEDDLGDVVRRKVIFDSERYASVPAYLVVPKDLSRGERRPGILCAHGHGVGKDSLVGVTEEEYQHQIALRLAREGYVTLSPDWRTFGERKDPDAWVRRPGRDGCNVAYLAHGYFGYQLLALQIHDAQVCLDYLQSLPQVAESRLGMIGCSFGGTMTSYVSALDDRVKVSIPVCYLSTIKSALTAQNGNTCGSQFAFGLLKHGEVSDVFGLIAPRPCMPQIGEQDQCFLLDDALKAARHLKAIYKAAGAADKLAVDVFPGVHEIDVESAVGFFRAHL
jgi:dienelactone hydrolase